MCMWRTGHIIGDERRRPDNLGLMFHATRTIFGQHLMCWETKLNAVRDNRYLLDKIAAKVLVCVMLFNEQAPELPGQRMFIGPPSEMAEVSAVKNASMNPMLGEQ